MRERGSSTARPTEKGGGGLPIRSIRSISARRVVPIRSISSRFGVLIVSVESIWSAAWVAIRSRVASIRSISSRFADFLLAFRPDSVDSLESCRVETRGANTKKARFLNREIGLSYRKASRALNLRLIPRANTRASVRSVLLGLARRSCIVMLTSDRRRIVHYT